MGALLFAPHIIYGIAYNRSGAVIPNAVVTALNTATGDEINTTANSLGQFAFDCSNFENGYYNGQVVKLSATSSAGAEYDLSFSVDGGNSWQQVENNKTTNLTANSVRTKLNINVFPGGRTDLNVRLIA